MLRSCIVQPKTLQCVLQLAVVLLPALQQLPVQKAPSRTHTHTHAQFVRIPHMAKNARISIGGGMNKTVEMREEKEEERRRRRKKTPKKKRASCCIAHAQGLGPALGCLRATPQKQLVQHTRGTHHALHQRSKHHIEVIVRGGGGFLPTSSDSRSTLPGLSLHLQPYHNRSTI